MKNYYLGSFSIYGIKLNFLVIEENKTELHRFIELKSFYRLVSFLKLEKYSSEINFDYNDYSGEYYRKEEYISRISDILIHEKVKYVDADCILDICCTVCWFKVPFKDLTLSNNARSLLSALTLVGLYKIIDEVVEYSFVKDNKTHYQYLFLSKIIGNIKEIKETLH